MAQDLFSDFVFGQEKPADAMAATLDARASAPELDLFETFAAGAQSGVKGLKSDLEYFKAAGQTIIGDDVGAAESVRDARVLEQLAGLNMEGVETFSEFLEEPTVEGFLTQVASGTGQILPSAILSVAGAGAGAVAAVGIRQGAGQTAKHLSKKLIQEAAEATAKGTATSAQKRLAQGGYEALREAYTKRKKSDLIKGGATGAYAAEYAPLTGGNVSEALEAGEELNPDTAIRAGLVAIPQAAVGVLGEAGMVKLLQGMATKKAVGDSSIWKKIGTDFVQAGATEGTAETIQEAISIANRVDLEPTYSEADQKLRLMQSMFTGFFGGGAIGGAGSAISSIASTEGLDAITEKSSDMLESIKEMVTSKTVSEEILGNTELGQTTKESERDINAQINAMVDPTSAKQSVWISGSEPDARIKGAKPNRVRKIKVNGQKAFAAFVPNRGTIISPDYDIVSEVLKGKATDSVLAAALGYSSTKTTDGDLAVRVYDSSGGIVSEEITNEENKENAEAVARSLAPKGGSFETIPVEEALADRARRNGPEVKMMEDDYDADDPLATEQNSNEEFGDGEFESDVRTHSFIKEGQETDSYQGVDGDNSFSGIDKARTAYIEMVGEDIDWNTPFYKRMSKSMLNTAVKLQEASPDEVINVKINKDGSYRIEIETTPDTQKIRIRDGKGVDDEVSMSEFLRRSISKAMGSKQEYRSVNITAPGSDAAVSVNPVDLMNAGRRIMESIEGSFTGAGAQQSSRQGLLAMLGQLQMAGYEVDIQGVPITDIMANLENPKIDLPPNISNLTVGFNEAGKKIKLGQLLKPYVPGAPDGDLESVFNGLTLLAPEKLIEIGRRLRKAELIVVDEKTAINRARISGNPNTLPNQIAYKDALRAAYLPAIKKLIRTQGGIDVFEWYSKNPALTPEEQRSLEPVETEEEIEFESDDVVTDSLEMTESSARTPDGIPLTDMNIADLNNTNSTQNRPIGSAPQTNTDTISRRPEVNFKTGTTFPFGQVNDLVSSIVSRISRRLKLNNPIALISLKGFNTATRDQIGSYLINKKTAKGRIALKALETLDLGDHVAVGKFLKQANADGLLAKKISNEVAKVDDVTLLGQSLVMRAAVDILRKQTTSVRIAEQIAATLVGGFNSTNSYKGYFQKFSNGSVIMINDLHNTNEAALAMVAAHEMGHALFKEEINSLFENKPLYNRMYAAFVRDRQKARDEEKPVKQWETVGFEEWYADQVAAWAKNDNQTNKRGASNAVDSHFKRVVAKFKKIWAEMKNHPSQVYRRVNELKPSFAKYMAGVTAARKANNMTTQMPVYNEAGEIVAYKSALGSIVEEATTTPAATAPTPAQEAGAEVARPPAQAAKPAPLPEPIEPPFEQVAMIQSIKESIRAESGFQARESAWGRKMKSWSQMFSEEFPQATKIFGLLRTADGMMRMTAGNEVADLFYVESNSMTGTGLGFVRSRQLARDRLRADLFKIMGVDWTTQEIVDGLKEAQSKTPTAGLQNKKAKEIRLFLEGVHKSYVVPSNTEIGFRENYYPVLLNLGEIANDPNAFVNLILANDSTVTKASEKKIRRAVKNLVLYQKASDPNAKKKPKKEDEDAADNLDQIEPGEAAEASMVLTRNISPDVLKEAGFLQEPEIALMSYLDNITKRVEWNRYMRAPDGTNKLKEGLAKLTPSQREITESVINAYLGNVAHLPPMWRKAQSYMQAINLVTLLPFAAFASIPDFAGSVVNTREFSGFAMFGKQLVASIQDRESAKRLANDIGVVMPEAAANAWLSQADSDMMDPKVRMATDTFFKFTGLSALTTLSREFSSGMGKQFIIEHANHPMSRSTRYLAELGLTAEQVKRWQDNDFSFEGEDGAAVRDGLVRFVESSVLRPNAAERPIWASDPRFALIWQLKSFLYAFNKVILEGQSREFQSRLKEGTGLAPAMAPLLLLTMAAFMPLAALGLELREYAKVGLSYAIPWTDGSTRYLRSDSMDWGTYFRELFGRAGLDGPIGMLTMAQRSSDWGGSALATLLGPTAELGEKLLTDGPIDTAWSRVNSPPETVGAILGISTIAPWPKINSAGSAAYAAARAVL